MFTPKNRLEARKEELIETMFLRSEEDLEVTLDPAKLPKDKTGPH